MSEEGTQIYLVEITFEPGEPPTPTPVPTPTPELYGTHEENVHLGIGKGLGFLHAIVSSDDEWDRYEGYQCRAAERYARAHPEDPDVADLLKLSHHYRDTYLRWGRETLGWAIYVFIKAPGDAGPA